MSEQQHKDLYGDEVATEVHDIMHQAEEEEERVSHLRFDFSHQLPTDAQSK